MDITDDGRNGGFSTRIVGLAGWSGAGKTTLITRLIPILRARSIRVSTLKHAHHAFDIDKPGKDSYQHRQAGAEEVLVASSRRWALLHEMGEESEPDLRQLIAKLSPVDLVLIEGFKSAPVPKLEVHRSSIGKPLLYPGDTWIKAIAADRVLRETGIPLLDLDDAEVIADKLVAIAMPLGSLFRLPSPDTIAVSQPGGGVGRPSKE